MFVYIYELFLSSTCFFHLWFGQIFSRSFLFERIYLFQPVVLFSSERQTDVRLGTLQLDLESRSVLSLNLTIKQFVYCLNGLIKSSPPLPLQGLFQSFRWGSDSAHPASHPVCCHWILLRSPRARRAPGPGSSSQNRSGPGGPSVRCFKRSQENDQILL